MAWGRSAAIQHTKRILKIDLGSIQSTRLCMNIWLIFGVNSQHCQWVGDEAGCGERLPDVWSSNSHGPHGETDNKEGSILS